MDTNKFLASIDIPTLVAAADPFRPSENTQDPFLDDMPKDFKEGYKLGRSVSVRLGNFREALMLAVARATHGEKHVPKVICGYGVTPAEAAKYVVDNEHFAKQIILAKLDPDAIQKAAYDWLRSHAPIGHPKFVAFLKHVRKNKDLFVSDKIVEWAVDTVVFHPLKATALFECKSSADLDTGKSENMVHRDMLLRFALLNDTSAEVYLSVGYDSAPQGSRSRWKEGKHTVQRFLAAELCVPADQIYNDWMLPPNIWYSDLYRAVKKEIALNYGRR